MYTFWFTRYFLGTFLVQQAQTVPFWAHVYRRASLITRYRWYLFGSTGTDGTFLGPLSLFLKRDLSFWSTPPCVYTCLLHFLVENKQWTTFSLISIGRQIKGRLGSSLDMSRVPILFNEVRWFLSCRWWHHVIGHTCSKHNYDNLEVNTQKYNYLLIY